MVQLSSRRNFPFFPVHFLIILVRRTCSFDCRDSIFSRIFHRLHRFPSLADPWDVSSDTIFRDTISLFLSLLFLLIWFWQLLLLSHFSRLMAPTLSRWTWFSGSPSAVPALQRYADFAFIKNSLSSYLPFISARKNLSRITAYSASASRRVVEIYFNLLAVKACQFLRCSLISGSPFLFPFPFLFYSATLLADPSPSSARRIFCIFLRKKIALSFSFSFPLHPCFSLAFSLFSHIEILPRERFSLSCASVSSREQRACV